MNLRQFYSSVTDILSNCQSGDVSPKKAKEQLRELNERAENDGLKVQVDVEAIDLEDLLYEMQDSW